MVKLFFAGQVMLTVIVHGPAPLLIEAKAANVQSTFVMVTLPAPGLVLGCVHPAGNVLRPSRFPAAGSLRSPRTAAHSASVHEQT